MCDFEELTVYLTIDNRTRFIDGTQRHNDILIYLPRLHTFIFYISTKTEIAHSVLHPSEDNIQRNFIDMGYEQVAYVIYSFSDGHALCNIFSLSLTFARVELIGNNFPNIIFKDVPLVLWMCETVSLKQEFFVRIARCFPLLKSFIITNCDP